MYTFDIISFAYFDIFNFINKEDLFKYSYKLINKEISETINSIIIKYKKSNLIYKLLLKNKNIDINSTNIYFFKTEMIINKYKNFKNFIFDLMKKNNYRNFYLSSVRFKLHYVISVDKENILVFCDDNMGNIYYNGFFLNYKTYIPYDNTGEQLCGYIYKYNKFNNKNKNLLNYI